MNSEKQLRGFILTRFFIVLILVSLVEFAVVIVTNLWLFPALIDSFNLNALLNVKSAEKLFLIVFVFVANSIVNSVFPFLKLPTDSVTAFLESLLTGQGSDVAEAREVLRNLSQDTNSLWFLLLALLVIAIVLITPYVMGGIFFSLSVAREIRTIEHEKEEERKREEKRRYLMISNIVHDLKTPMTTVYGYA